jgi:dTDP-glucose 4,6-dehydratase
MILVTGGAGFIGSNFVLDWLAAGEEPVLNLDALTYAGNLRNLATLQGDARHLFVRGDIADRALIDELLARHRPRAIVHFAAESHVDRSIHGPGEFVRTNVQGTFTLLKPLALTGPGCLSRARGFRFLHVTHRRGLRQPEAGARAFTEEHLRAQQPVLGQQGRERSPRARLAPHLRAAGADDQLLATTTGPITFPRS